MTFQENASFEDCTKAAKVAKIAGPPPRVQPLQSSSVRSAVDRIIATIHHDPDRPHNRNQPVNQRDTLSRGICPFRHSAQPSLRQWLRSAPRVLPPSLMVSQTQPPAVPCWVFTRLLPQKRYISGSYACLCSPNGFVSQKRATITLDVASSGVLDGLLPSHIWLRSAHSSHSRGRRWVH
jgi:hypothetical protein